jgi:Zn finger protein HypA/HybF involved in hydrogenase expression
MQLRFLPFSAQVVSITIAIIDTCINDLDRKSKESLEEVSRFVGLAIYLIIKQLAFTMGKITKESLLHALSTAQITLYEHNAQTFAI